MQRNPFTCKLNDIGSSAHLTEIQATLQGKWPAKNSRRVFSPSRNFYSKLSEMPNGANSIFVKPLCFSNSTQVKILPDQNEKRHHTRITLGSEIAVKLAGSSEQQLGRCKSISGAGVSFITNQALPQGKAAEIHVFKSALGPPVTAFVEIIRCTQLTTRSFEIAAAIKSIKGC